MQITIPRPVTAEYVLPHEDVVLFALVHVANMNAIHPWAIAKATSVRRPALMQWISGNISAMHYSAMRQLIAKLVNSYGVVFDAEGFTIPGHKYMRCRHIAPPIILANPSAL